MPPPDDQKGWEADIDQRASLVHPAAMFYPALAIILGLILLIWPHEITAWMSRRRDNRLRELRNGDPEEFFEERRSLETYSRHIPPFGLRVFGGAWVILGIVSAVRGGH